MVANNFLLKIIPGSSLRRGTAFYRNVLLAPLVVDKLADAFFCAGVFLAAIDENNSAILAASHFTGSHAFLLFIAVV